MPRGLFKIPTNKISFSDAEEVLDLTDGPNSEGWYHGHCPCPYHDDDNPSFGVLEGDDGGLIVYCLQENSRILIEPKAPITIHKHKRLPYKTKMIKELRVGDKVGTLSSNGTCWKPVIKKYINPRNNRAFIKVRPKHSTKWGQGTIFTDNHFVCTPTGWKQVGKLKNEDFIIVAEPTPNKKMKELIDGTLLGDASIFGAGLTFQQSNVEYGRLKQWGLGTLKPYGQLLDRSNCSIPNAKNAWLVRIPSGTWSKQQRERWYPKDKKIIPKDLKLTDLTLAVWYMDDGSLDLTKKNRPSIHLATMGFMKKDIEYLQLLLKEQNIQSTIGKNKSLYINVVSSEYLLTRISKFIPPSMRYKTTSLFPKFDLSAWNLGNHKPINVDTVSIQEIDRKDKTVYCIEVKDTHNFITNVNLVSHNCFAGCEPKDIYDAIRDLLNED